jgi:tRNA 2-thiouridine synthesizing protein E
MEYDVNGAKIEATDNGYLTDYQSWNEDVAKAIAAEEGIELTDKHMDVLNYLRDQYINNGGVQPNDRTILKDMGKIWGASITSKDMYTLFPNQPSKQAGKIAGLPESLRKGGY